MITLFGFAPAFYFSSYWVFFSIGDDEGSRDCDVLFQDTDANSYEFARVACVVRTWSYIVGIALIGVGALGPIVLGSLEFLPALCQPRLGAWLARSELPRQPRDLYSTVPVVGTGTTNFFKW